MCFCNSFFCCTDESATETLLIKLAMHLNACVMPTKLSAAVRLLYQLRTLVRTGQADHGDHGL